MDGKGGLSTCQLILTKHPDLPPLYWRFLIMLMMGFWGKYFASDSLEEIDF
jgi:hypothetical protein